MFVISKGVVFLVMCPRNWDHDEFDIIEFELCKRGCTCASDGDVCQMTERCHIMLTNVIKYRNASKSREIFFDLRVCYASYYKELEVFGQPRIADKHIGQCLIYRSSS